MPSSARGKKRHYAVIAGSTVMMRWGKECDEYLDLLFHICVPLGGF